MVSLTHQAGRVLRPASWAQSPDRQFLADIRGLTAPQQPRWCDLDKRDESIEDLRSCEGLVDPESIGQLSDELGAVAGGSAFVVQAGDCAEDPDESGARDALRKAGLVHALANSLAALLGAPVVRAGRIAGQYAKPRSAAIETLPDGRELPVYRGHLVNSPEPRPEDRVHDPIRLVSAREAAARLNRHLARITGESGHRVWTSHEALILDYELPQVRGQLADRYLASTHWPWIGNRTNAVSGAHVALLSAVSNPVAVKVGPDMSPPELIELCDRLDPHRLPGRLTLISRMGATKVESSLPPLMAAAAQSGHAVIWLCDPMHGNTVKAENGLKTRRLGCIMSEVRSFVEAAARSGVRPAGLHLEATADDVAECVLDDGHAPDPTRCTSLCDPRLSLDQALDVVQAFAEATQ